MVLSNSNKNFKIAIIITFYKMIKTIEKLMPKCTENKEEQF